MNYEEALKYLYDKLQAFHLIGPRAYKPGLETTYQLCRYLGNPQDHFKSIHIAGTNGKGSSSHMTAAVLQKAGYKVGLYTSPHLKSFTERFRVNGINARPDFVADFVSRLSSEIEKINPSFFEVTVALAFEYFRQEKVDVAIIEVGLGGRLDSTNIIQPEACLITNISFDHAAQLGNSLPAIAKEKAGIIKKRVPVIISERGDPVVQQVFKETSAKMEAPIYWANDRFKIKSESLKNGQRILEIDIINSGKKIITNKYSLDLIGDYQALNVLGVLCLLSILETRGWQIPEKAKREGLANVRAITGLRGRWQILLESPKVICDTAHNYAGLALTLAQFRALSAKKQHFVLGFVKDKDLDSILPLFPPNASYYFCQPNNMRALEGETLKIKAKAFGVEGEVFANVNLALRAALMRASSEDAIYVGGSTFVVAELENI